MRADSELSEDEIFGLEKAKSSLYLPFASRQISHVSRIRAASNSQKPCDT